MKKKALTTIISIFTIFFLFSSISYAFTPAEWVAAHNKYRRRHVSTPDVTWDNTLAQGAQDRVNKVKGTNWSHTLYTPECGAFGYRPDAQDAVDGWYSEEQYYDYDTGTKKKTVPADKVIGHFLQVVGSNIKKIGCASDPSGKTFIDGQWWTGIYVCQYDDFGKNIRPVKKIGGESNILWYHDDWGLHGVWYMDGASYKSAAWTGYVPDTNWQIAGAADFNNDGETDILWRNSYTGANTVWLMEGSQLKSDAPIDSVADLDWKIVSTGDFDADGRTDILWRHATDKYTRIWLMDGVKLIKSISLPWSTHPDWKIVGAGDFNSDYHTDVLWRNTANGSNAVWYISGGKYQGLNFLSSGAHLDWDVGATGDLNDDNKTDILWRNNKTGANAVWYMDGVNFKSSDWLPPNSDLNWKIVGTGNFE